MTGEHWIDPLLGAGRYPFFALLVLVTLLLGRSAISLRSESGNESMNARSPARSAAYEAFKTDFGNDEDILLALTRAPLLDPEGLQVVDELSSRIAALDGVAGVTSLTTARRIVAGPDGAADAPLVGRPWDVPDLSSRIEGVLGRNPHLDGLLISHDRSTAGILIRIEDRAPDDRFRERLIEKLRDLQGWASEGVELHLTGIAVQKHDATRYVTRDQAILLPLSALVLATLLALIFRRKSGVVLPLLVTGLTLVWTLGLYARAGHELNIITSLLPPVVMVLSITTSLHLYHGWVALAHVERTEAAGRRLVRRLVRSLAAPCALTALTTAMGLVSLTVSDIPAVRLFGLYSALGVLISFGLNITLLPAVLPRLSPPRRRVNPHDGLGRLLRRAAEWTVRRPRGVLIVAAVPTLLALGGIGQIRNNTDLVRFLKPDAPLRRDTAFVDARLSGVNTLELVVQRRDGEPLTAPEDLRRMADLARAVADLDHVSGLLSIVNVIEQLHRAERDAETLELPRDPDDVLYYFDLLEAAEQQDELRRIITSDFRKARINVRIRGIGTAEAAELVREIESAARRHLGEAYESTPTGAFYNVTMDANHLVANQVKSFTLALAMVLLALALVFRSLELLAAALAPNLLPILWTGGVMGWLGIDLSTATTMIASVVLGIAVDDTIHYLARFRWEHSGNCSAAIRRTTCTTGRVLVITSFVLACGFWVAAFGSFKPTIYFSLLTGATILSALVCDLLVLPACLVLLRPAPSDSPPD